MGEERDRLLDAAEKKHEYHVEGFDGPLDLLLELIKKNNLNIYNIDISLITGEFIASGLARILELEEADILERLEKTWSMYEIIKYRVDEDTRNAVYQEMSAQTQNLLVEAEEATAFQILMVLASN